MGLELANSAILLRGLLLLGVWLILEPEPAFAQAIDADTVITLCRGCHRDKFDALATNPHAALDTAQWRERADAAVACVACHGSVDQHIRSGGGTDAVFAFRDEPIAEQLGRCLNCHSDTHPQFEQSPHARAGVTCFDCHSQHGSSPASSSLLHVAPTALLEPQLGAKSAVCFDCHGEVFTQFRANERHRLFEGAVQCVSCHNPHEPQTRQLLGGFKQEQCASCHADKTGPFVFEHRASRVEGCTACHSPHGNSNRHLLSHQRVGELCFSCHAEVPQFHLGFSPVGEPRFNLDTQCTNCHSAIHGSNFDEIFLR